MHPTPVLTTTGPTVSDHGSFLRIVLCALAACALCAACEAPVPKENVRRNEDTLPGQNTGGGEDNTGENGSASNGANDNGSGGPDAGDNGNDNGSSANGNGSGAEDAGAEEPWPTPTFSKKRLLEATAKCATLHYDDFLEQAGLLREAAEAFADKRQDTQRDAARSAWRAAFASWQRAEAFVFGPASGDAMTGGKGLRDQIYAYPLINRCAIDANIVSQAYSGDGLRALPVNQRGLGALEYLLFYAGTSNACAASNVINTDGKWAALSKDEIEKRRAAYAAQAARDVRSRAQALVDAWAPDKGDFTSTFINTGGGNAVFGSQQIAFDAVNEALYYIELEIKDHKLGGPLAVQDPCVPSCSALVETPYARVSTDALRQNLIGTRKLFEGCGPAYSGLGFENWLITAGNAGLASDMVGALDDIQRAIDTLDPPLETAIAKGTTRELSALYQKVKAFTDQLKSDFITTLDLEPPAGAVGDND